ncbi:MAG TPA: DnaJ domain-containing protein [Candidatus Polarisedimenticolia bacterium]|jgi:curved DNA-binding protein CbpA|nr:DnaJ domain-containing protein [Candidatus Polarisedimenticolia bacterium]
MNGSLARRSPSDVLAEVLRRQASGIMRLKNAATTRQLFIDAGVMIRFAVSTLPSESITGLFRDKGGVTEAQVKHATAVKTADELLGTALVRTGALTKEALAGLTREHIHRVTLGALATRDGEFEFQAGALPFREQLDGGLGSPEILLEWARAFPEIDWIRRRLGQSEARVQLSRRPPEGYQKVPLNPAEGFIMSRVDGSSSVGDIISLSPMGEENTLRALFGLALAGILEMPDGAAEIPLPPATSTSPGPVPRTAPAVPHAPAARPATVPAAAAGAAPAPVMAARPPAVAAVRTPTNGGATAPPAQAAAPAAPRSPAKGPAPAAAPRPASRPPASRPAMAPRRVTSVTERVRPTASPDLEAEMLQRFDQLREQDLYQVLGVIATANADEVRRAYYALAKKFHPDKFMREDAKTKAEKVFAHITEAYSTLTNPETRTRYDEDQALRKSSREPEKKVDPGAVAHINFRHGKDMFDKGKLGEAITFLQNACDQDPSKAEHFHYLAIAQSKNPRWKKDAEENFLKAIEKDPMNAEIYAHLGSLYARGGMHSKARDMFKKALQWDPAQQEASEGLAQLEEGKKGLLGMFKK